LKDHFHNFGKGGVGYKSLATNHTILFRKRRKLMSKFFAVVVLLALIVTVAVSPVWAVGDKVRSDKAAGPAGTTGGGDPQASRGTPVGESVEPLSVSDVQEYNKSGYILYIREEEKLARDVYLTLYELYPAATIFETISKSEQRHMDAVKKLIDKYDLIDPVSNNEIGAFSGDYFADLHARLVEQGEQNYCEALKVGIDIENLDIEDIENALNEIVEAQDVNRVLSNLLNGSYNHLNAFTSHYEAAGCP
jgi:hypothetical protein